VLEEIFRQDAIEPHARAPARNRPKVVTRLQELIHLVQGYPRILIIEFEMPCEISGNFDADFFSLRRMRDRRNAYSDSPIDFANCCNDNDTQSILAFGSFLVCLVSLKKSVSNHKARDRLR